MKFAFPLLLSLFLFACKSKKNDPAAEPFFPVKSFLGSQVAHVDTSVYAILRITPVDSNRADTQYIRREDFRATAAEFLALPDLTEKRYEDRFTESKQFDQSLNRVILTYLPVNPEKEEIQRQEILIQPDPSGDKLKTIMITKVNNNRDSSVNKQLLWKADESFQVRTIKQVAGQPETTTSYRVVWNESEF